jgi:hypothetical protein
MAQRATAAVNEDGIAHRIRVPSAFGRLAELLGPTSAVASPAAKDSISPQLPQNLPPGVWAVPHWGQNMGVDLLTAHSSKKPAGGGDGALPGVSSVRAAG